MRLVSHALRLMPTLWAIGSPRLIPTIISTKKKKSNELWIMAPTHILETRQHIHAVFSDMRSSSSKPCPKCAEDFQIWDTLILYVKSVSYQYPRRVPAICLLYLGILGDESTIDQVKQHKVSDICKMIHTSTTIYNLPQQAESTSTWCLRR